MTDIVGEARFQLAEDRVRNLLMGEALYKDSSLAVRELYQNAVDATRHAAARIEYLNRLSSDSLSLSSCPPQPSSCRRQDLQPDPTMTAGDPDFRQDDNRRMTTPYVGNVQLVQNTEGDQEYIECTDNGVGMGIREITGVFAQAGMRSTDSAEFAAELTEYARLDPPIDLWTNSRFGIGALSYFMLADRIEITTTRLHRDGTLGETLHVDITGPETYFRITGADQATSHGTTVRLWLREPGTVSAIAVLGKSLIVAPVRVRVTEPSTGGEISWDPDRPNTECVADPARRVWWIPASGSVLSDGLETAMGTRAAYIDLKGVHAPKLAVDRNTLLDYDKEYVRRTLTASVGTLLRDATRDQLETICGKVFFSPDANDVAIADALSDGIARCDVVMGTLQGSQVNLARTGHIHDFPALADNWVTSAALLGDPDRCGELGVASWEPILRPRPSDSLLLTGWESLFNFLGRDMTDGNWPLPVLGISAARLGWSVEDTRARYADLGFRFPHWHPDLRWDEDVVQILTDVNVHDPRGFHLNRFPVCEMAMAQLGLKLGLDIHDVAGILDQWEVPRESLSLFTNRRPTIVEERFFYTDTSSSFAERRGKRTVWRHKGAQIPIYTLIDIADDLHQGLRETAEMARGLGFDTRTLLIDTVTDLHKSVQFCETKWELLVKARTNDQSPSRLLEAANDLGAGFDPGLRLDAAPDMGDFEPPNDTGPLHRSAVIFAHRASSTPEDEVAAAFEWAGFTLVSPDLDDMDPLDLALVSRETDDDCPSVIDVATPLNPYWVMIQASRRQVSASDVLHRYIRLGFTVTSPDCVIEPTPNLLMLVSKSGNTPDLDTLLLDPETHVSASRVLLAVRQTRLPIDDILTMYTWLGLHPEDPRAVLPVLRPGPIPPQY